jgi:hypothetical protein
MNYQFLVKNDGKFNQYRLLTEWRPYAKSMDEVIGGYPRMSKLFLVHDMTALVNMRTPHPRLVLILVKQWPFSKDTSITAGVTSALGISNEKSR